MSFTLSKAALIAVTLAVAGTSVAEAAPSSVTPKAAVGLEQATGGNAVDQVAYRRRYYGGYAGRGYGRRYGYNPAGAAVAGAALGLLGAGIAAAAAPSYGYGYGYGRPAYGYGYAPYGGYGYPAYGYGW